MLVCPNTFIARPNTSPHTFHSPLTLETAQITQIFTEIFETVLKLLKVASNLLEHCLEWLKISLKSCLCVCAAAVAAQKAIKRRGVKTVLKRPNTASGQVLECPNTSPPLS